MVNASNPLDAKLTTFAIKTELPALCYYVRPKKPLRVNQQVMNHKSV